MIDLTDPPSHIYTSRDIRRVSGQGPGFPILANASIMLESVCEDVEISDRSRRHV